MLPGAGRRLLVRETITIHVQVQVCTVTLLPGRSDPTPWIAAGFRAAGIIPSFSYDAVLCQTGEGCRHPRSPKALRAISAGHSR